MQLAIAIGVKKISKGKLHGDTFIIGVGSSWQEVEMVYGTPISKKGECTYEYDGMILSDWYLKGVPPKGYKYISRGPQAVLIKNEKYVSDAGVKIGMSRDEVYKALKSKYVKKNMLLKKDDLMIYPGKGNNANNDTVIQFAMQDTKTYNLFLTFENGKLSQYVVAPH